MTIRDLHPWNLTVTEAKRIQQELRRQLQLTDSIRLEDVRVVAGVDNAYTREADKTTAHAAVVLLNFPALEIIETTFASCPIDFPYVPGLLAFREVPAIIAAFRKIVTEPDVVLLDGQGYAHPRRFGLASHVGVILDRPTVGCAKSRLVGHYEEPGQEFGSYTPLIDRGEQVGAAVRTQPFHSPLFVSPGHKISLDMAVRIVLACCRDNQFTPEPTRLAHTLVTRYAHGNRPQQEQLELRL
jgi:deoxyribonuclease V